MTSRITLVIALTGAVMATGGLPGPVQAADDPVYINGKQNWLIAKYPPAYDLLIEYRGKPYGRTAEVDYMLGTSGCRTAGLRERGARMLAWLFYNYSLTPRSREMVTREWERCKQMEVTLAALDQDSMREVDSLISAGASFRGKMFYSIQEGEPVASYPARPVRTIDPAELRTRIVPLGEAQRASEAVAGLMKARAPGAKIRVLGSFVFITTARQSDETLKQFGAKLEQYVDFLVRKYDVARPKNYMSVYLVGSPEELRKLGNDLHGLDISPATIGYTFRDDQSAVAVVPGAQIGTLFHELFHLLVRNNFGDIPQWLDEGIASLYEVSSICEDEVIGIPNWRGQVLKDLWHERPSLSDMIRMEWFGSDVPEIAASINPDSPRTTKMAASMALARYFVLYLQEQGLLATVYAKYRERDPLQTSIDPRWQAVQLVEGAFQRSIADVDANFSRWFRDTPVEKLVRPRGNACETVIKYVPQ